MKKRIRVRLVFVVVATQLFLTSFWIGEEWTNVTASIFDAALIGAVASAVAWCLPGNRAEHAKETFDFVVMGFGMMLLAAEVVRHF